MHEVFLYVRFIDLSITFWVYPPRFVTQTLCLSAFLPPSAVPIFPSSRTYPYPVPIPAQRSPIAINCMYFIYLQGSEYISLTYGDVSGVAQSLCLPVFQSLPPPPPPSAPPTALLRSPHHLLPASSSYPAQHPSIAVLHAP